VTLDVQQMFKVKGQRSGSQREITYSQEEIVTFHERIGQLS